jgi:LysM repeat protein
MMNFIKGHSRRLVFIYWLMGWLIIIFLISPKPPRSFAAPDGAQGLIAAVNELRASRGLAPYTVNASLMASAQGHSNYMAANGSITHTGAGGTRPKDRAIAAGYGGGKAVFVSENIAGGGNWTVSSVIQLWMGDYLHQNTMLNPKYKDAGAGVASSGNTNYFTLDVGYIAGSAGSGSGSSGSGTVPNEPTKPVVIPVQKATPLPDGSIVHIVQQGQALWNIAAIYDINLQELMELNGFTNSTLIYPGDKILIKAADNTATPTEITPTATATETKKPTLSPTPESAATLTVQITPPTSTPPTSTGKTSSTAGIDPLLIIISVLILIGIGMVFVGAFLNRKSG